MRIVEMLDEYGEVWEAEINELKDLTSYQKRRYEMELGALEYKKAIEDAKFNKDKAELDYSWNLISYDERQKAREVYEEALDAWAEVAPSYEEAFGYYKLDDMGIEY